MHERGAEQDAGPVTTLPQPQADGRGYAGYLLSLHSAGARFDVSWQTPNERIKVQRQRVGRRLEPLADGRECD